MSVIEINPRVIPIEEVIIDDDSIDDEKSIHLWKTLDPLMRPLCGAKSAKHGCNIFPWKGQNYCPGCGGSLCSYCLLLAQE